MTTVIRLNPRQPISLISDKQFVALELISGRYWGSGNFHVDDVSGEVVTVNDFTKLTAEATMVEEELPPELVAAVLYGKRDKLVLYRPIYDDNGLFIRYRFEMGYP